MAQRRRGLLCLAVVMLAMPFDAAQAQRTICGPSFSKNGPNAAAYGADRNYPAGDMRSYREQAFRVGSFTAFDKIFPKRIVAAPAQALELKRDCDAAALSYVYEGNRRTIDNYLSRHPTTGLLILKDNTILLERYQYGRTDTDRFVSQSMAKTIMAMLFGIAKDEGKIRSLDDLAQDYVPDLKGSAYGETPLRALLTMSSGVAFTETYDGTDDNAKMGRGLRVGPGAAKVMARFNTREFPPGKHFHYASSESEVLGLVVMGATGKPLADYASEKLWKPMGAEADASWALDGRGQEMGYCCFNATLRDYARLGAVLARDGAGADGAPIIPRNWVIEATSVAPDSYLAPGKTGAFLGYGYQTWIIPGRRRMFALQGVYGQSIRVDPDSKIVLVHTAVRANASNNPEVRELNALWYGVVQQLSGANVRPPPPAK
jgi:CubicO group peptidase (beta-lactamase class C family)